MTKPRAFLSRSYHKLMQIRDTPHAIAGGVAIGVVLGVTPLFGFKTLLALIVAWLSRCSKLAAVVVVTLYDIFLPIWPVVLRWQYVLGYWLLNHHPPPKFALRHFHIDAWLHWKTLEIFWPIFLGSLVMALPLALIFYFVTLKIVATYQRRHQPSATPS